MRFDNGVTMLKRLSRGVFGLVLAVGALAAQAQTNSESSLDAVMKAGVLRACTPGDYKPFSFLTSDGAYEGIDIDLAQSLATAMGAKLEVVKTSWANLMPDFTAGKCDVGIGGISVTTERQKRAFFSEAYMVNGKTPIVRCDDVAKYQSVAAIDKAGVRVIEKPGWQQRAFREGQLQDRNADDPPREPDDLRRDPGQARRCVRDGGR